MGEKILCQDVPLQNIQLIGPSGYWVMGGVLISRGGFASAEVAIPEEFSSCRQIEPHARSRFARLGLNVMLGHAEAQRMRHAHSLPTHIQVTLANYGSFPLLMRNEDTITLANVDEVSTTLFASAPYITLPTIALTANQRFELIPDALPQRMCGDGWIRYIDPHDEMKWSSMRQVPLNTFEAKEGMFVVIDTLPHIRIPEYYIGIIRPIVKNMVHTSSVLVYPESNGNVLLLEFLALRDEKITHGDTLAVMTVHESDAA